MTLTRALPAAALQRSVAPVQAAVAAGLIAASLWLPLWTMTLEAPQYPRGLYLRAYGDRVVGDLREINIINHYVGMDEIASAPAPEMALFPFAIWTLVALALASPWSVVAGRLALTGVIAVPVITLADLQWWLHRFGQNLDPKAPLRFVEPFTPLAIGISKIGNFKSTAMISYGFFAWGAAAVLLYFVVRRRRPANVQALATLVATAAAMFVLAAVSTASSAAVGPGPLQAHIDAAAVAPGSLQARIDAAPDHGVVEVVGGVHSGPLRVDRGITLRGRDGAVVRGDGRGSVIVVAGVGATVRGLIIERSGRDISAEAAGVKVTGAQHTIVENLIRDVYFGVHLAKGHDNVVRGNHIRPGVRDGARPGHGISLWYEQRARVESNDIADSRDGIYLSFANDVRVVGNRVRGARYGIHSMYSQRATLDGNELRDNLLGAALMYSDELTMRCNRIEGHVEGATAYGVLLKDIGELLFEGNLLRGNRVGVYADNVPVGIAATALLRANRIVGHDVALALQSTARLTVTANTIAGNLTPVRTEGGDLSRDNRWSVDGVGNYWDGYIGFDRDGDGVGDAAFRHDAVMDRIVRAQPLAQAFLYTPAHSALERAARMFPLVQRAPLVVDPYPLMAPREFECDERTT